MLLITTQLCCGWGREKDCTTISYLWQQMEAVVNQTGRITSGPWLVEYLVFGTGDNKVLAFHGFDNNADDFRVFHEAFGDRCTFVCVNLFYHGKSTCSIPADKARFTAEELKAIIRLLCTTLQIDRFSLLGFSLGGRICLKLIELFPEQIVSMLLLAPDGLRLSRWYRFVTANPVGRIVFKRTVRNPGRFIKVAGWVRSLRLIGEKQYKFVLHQFDTATKRQKVYDVWMIYRYILPEIKKIQALIEKYRIPVELYFGKRDTIIPLSFADAFTLSGQEWINVHALDAGHQLMRKDVVATIYTKTGLLK